jgi:hypothetical protein
MPLKITTSVEDSGFLSNLKIYEIFYGSIWEITRNYMKFRGIEHVKIREIKQNQIIFVYNFVLLEIPKSHLRKQPIWNHCLGSGFIDSRSSILG